MRAGEVERARAAFERALELAQLSTARDDDPYYEGGTLAALADEGLQVEYVEDYVDNIDGFQKIANQLTQEDYSFTTSSGTKDLIEGDVRRPCRR